MFVAVLCCTFEDWSCIFRTRSFTLCKNDLDFNDKSDSVTVLEPTSSSSTINLSVCCMNKPGGCSFTGLRVLTSITSSDFHSWEDHFSSAFLSENLDEQHIRIPFAASRDRIHHRPRFCCDSFFTCILLHSFWHHFKTIGKTERDVSNFLWSVCLRVGFWCQCNWFGFWWFKLILSNNNPEQLCGFGIRVSLSGFFLIWSLLITASLSSNTYNKASWREELTFEEIKSTLSKSLIIPWDFFRFWIVWGIERTSLWFVHRSLRTWLLWFVFPWRTATIRSQQSSSLLSPQNQRYLTFMSGFLWAFWCSRGNHVRFLSLHRETKFIIGFDFAVTLPSPESFCVLFDITSENSAELKWLMLNKHTRCFPSSRVKFPLVSMSQPIKSNSVGSGNMSHTFDFFPWKSSWLLFRCLQTHTTKLPDAKIGRLREQGQHYPKHWSLLEIAGLARDLSRPTTGLPVL